MAHRCGKCGREVSSSDSVLVLDAPEGMDKTWCVYCARGEPPPLYLWPPGPVAIGITACVLVAGVIIAGILTWRASMRPPTEAEFLSALRSGKVRIVERFLSTGVDPEAEYQLIKGPYKPHETALELAVDAGQAAVVEVLLAHGAVVDGTARDAMTPLHTAAGRSWPAVVQLLLEAGAHVDVRTSWGATPIHIMARWEPFGDAKATLNLLLDHGADIDARDNAGETPLHEALAVGRWEFAQALIAHGADPGARDRDGRSPLYSAVRSLSAENLTEFLQIDGVDVRVRDKTGMTPLHQLGSCRWDPDRPCTPTIEALLATGADINAADDRGWTPLHCASNSREGGGRDVGRLPAGARRRHQCPGQ